MVSYTCWIVCAVCDAIIYAHRDNIYRFYILFLSEMISYILISAEGDRCIICTIIYIISYFLNFIVDRCIICTLICVIGWKYGEKRVWLINLMLRLRRMVSVILSRISFDCVVQPYSERYYPTWAPRIFLTPSNSSSSKKSWIVTFYCYEPLLRLNDGYMKNSILCSVQVWRRECHDKLRLGGLSAYPAAMRL